MGHLHYSLGEGPTLLNLLLEDVPVSLSDDASVVAHQYDPLSNEANTEVNRELDLVVRDADTLLGVESKYGDSLGRSQLSDELAKLRANAYGRDVHLLAITHHVSEPGVIAYFENDPVSWVNWYSIVQELSESDRENLPPAQHVPYRMLRDLLKVEDMNPFTGFDHQDKQQYRYFIRTLRSEVNSLNLENRGDIHAWSSEAASPAGWKRIIPKYIGIPFVDTERPNLNEQGRPDSKHASVLLTVVDTETHSIYVGPVFDIDNVESHRTLLLERGEEIAAMYQQEGYELWVGRHSINNRSTPPEKTTNIDKMIEWLSDSGKQVLAHPNEDDNYRKVWFLKKCTETEPARQIESVLAVLKTERERLLDSNQYISESSLVDPSTLPE